MQRIASVKKADVFPLMSQPPIIGVVGIGTVASSGWTNSELTPWFYVVAPKDVIQDLDFYASEPTGRGFSDDNANSRITDHRPRTGKLLGSWQKNEE